jgi:hypothetical protein
MLYIEEYRRIRHGKIETVKAHWRKFPCGKPGDKAPAAGSAVGIHADGSSTYIGPKTKREVLANSGA